MHVDIPKEQRGLQAKFFVIMKMQDWSVEEVLFSKVENIDFG